MSYDIEEKEKYYPRHPKSSGPENHLIFTLKPTPTPLTYLEFYLHKCMHEYPKHKLDIELGRWTNE